MPIDKRRNKKLPDYLQQNDLVVSDQYYGTYIGVVRRTIDTQRLGRLLVFIPDLCTTDQEINWISVSYATPFYGSTDPNYNHENPNQEVPSKEGVNTFDGAKHSYGMWFVPPDPGVKVLITFVNGDLSKGFWFACIPEGHNHHMVPSLGGSANSNFQIENETLSGAAKPDRVPVVEYNVNDKTIDKDKVTEWIKIKKPVHQEQFKIVRNQGLEFDYYRGTVNSSSQRDMPSSTFGISSPGRPFPDPAFGAGLSDRVKSKTISEEELTPKLRKGGHTFVMDDGDVLGNDNFLRLRTGGGHQILLHDTGKFIYISNSTGTAWIELNEKGDIEIFSEGTFSLRAADSINFHADNNINMYAGKSLSIVAEEGTKIDTKSYLVRSTETIHMSAKQEVMLKSGTSMKLDAGSRLSAKAAGITSISGQTITLQGATDTVAEVSETTRQNFPNSIKENNQYKIRENRIKSIVTRVPTHEPDGNHGAISKQLGGSSVLLSQSANNNDGRVPAVITSPAISFGNPTSTDATKGISTGGVNLKNLDVYLSKQPDPSNAIQSLTKDETKALFTGIALSESNHNYQAVNQFNYIGKYQFGAAALTDRGYIKPAFLQKYKGSNAVLDDPNAWTGLSGINSKEDFLNNKDVQEKVMLEQAQANYDAMRRSGAIRKDDNVQTVSGMIQTAHLLGAGGAARWRETGEGKDANNVTGRTYFDKGKYAISALTIDGVIKT